MKGIMESKQTKGIIEEKNNKMVDAKLYICIQC